MTAAQVSGNRDEWKAIRRGSSPDAPDPCPVGASEIAGIMGIEGAHGSPWKLWMIKTGRWPDDDAQSTDAMRFGNYCEPWSRYLLGRDFTDLHFTDGGLYCHDGRPWQTATFDLLAHEAAACPRHAGGVCEAGPDAASAIVQQKNEVFTDWQHVGLPPHYRVQALWEASVAGLDTAYLAPFDRVSVRTELFEVPVDDDARRDIELMIEAAEWFRDLVRRDKPPRTDAHPATGEALRRRWSEVDPGKTAVVPWQAAVRWRRASLAVTAARTRQAGYLHRMLAAAQDAGTWMARDPGTGELVKVATRSVAPRVGYTVQPNPRVDTVRPCRRFLP